MPTRVIIGAQWGDEGKGKIVDLLSNQADYVVRYQGGANAGHTLKFDGNTYILHLIPSGIFHPETRCVIGNGVVIDPEALLSEMEKVRELDVSLEGRLFISETAHLILPFHKSLDAAKEAHNTEQAIGTTGRGIGPAYMQKTGRLGLRMIDLFYPNQLHDKVAAIAEYSNCVLHHLYGADTVDADEVTEDLLGYADKLRPFITNTVELLNNLRREPNTSLLLEGAQGTLLDLDHGTYPYVTSSSPTTGGACSGTGLPPASLGDIVGVTKAYCTRVGNGPFPTELLDEAGDELREAGNEFGSTTGRPRRCGWIDLVALKHAVDVNGINRLALTKLDVLDKLKTIKLCTSYRIDGEETRTFPLDTGSLKKAYPVYTELNGWSTPTRDMKKDTEIPANLRAFLDYIEDYLQVSIALISTGPDREEVIELGETELL